MKTLYVFPLFILCSLGLQAQQYMVQLAVYDRTVPDSHWSGLSERIFHSKDHNDFHHYFIGKYSAEAADAKADEMRAEGYRSVRVIGEGEFNQACVCFFTEAPKELTANLRSIFFDFDKYDLRSDARIRLDQLLSNLQKNPTYRVQLLAHTDGKGSDAYNEVLSMNRAKAARNYLTRRGVASSRIDIDTFGERRPIAKNTLADGRDTARGRQFNRRVEINVLDAEGTVLNVVEPIVVPEELKSR